MRRRLLSLSLSFSVSFDHSLACPIRQSDTSTTERASERERARATLEAGTTQQSSSAVPRSAWACHAWSCHRMTRGSLPESVVGSVGLDFRSALLEPSWPGSDLAGGICPYVWRHARSGCCSGLLWALEGRLSALSKKCRALSAAKRF